MKSIKLLTLTVALFAALPLLATQENHGHSHAATPKGGRALEKTSPLAELVIEKDRTVTINFYNADMKPVAATTQTVTVIANAKEKTTLEFEKKNDVLASKTKLPEGNGYNLVVQFKQTADAKPQNFRFKLDLATCSDCKRAEYACACHH